MRRSNWFSLAFLLSVCLATTGCLEKTEKVSLNPDGSGKREFDLLMVSTPPLNLGNAAKKPEAPPEEQIKVAVQKLIDSSKGVDAWKDLQYNIAKDGRFHIKGVAYFKDFNSVSLTTSLGGGNPQTWKKEGDAMILDCSLKAKEKPKQPVPATDAEVDQKVTQVKMQWAQTKPLFTGILEKMRDDVTYVLPGKIAEAGAFESKPEGVRLVLEGSKVLTAMDALMSDDAAIRAAIQRGGNVMDEPPSEETSKMIFGKAGKPIAKVTGPLTPTFDYAKESAAAKTAMPEMFQTLGLTAPGAPKPVATPAPAPAAEPAPAK